MKGDTFDLEKKFSAFCDGVLYPALGIKVLERYTDAIDQRERGDKLIQATVDGIVMPALNVDEKCASYMHDCMLWELIQDVRTKNMGWFYDLKMCDRIIYGYYNRDDVTVVYSVQWEDLREFAFKAIEGRDTSVRFVSSATGKGWGAPVSASYPWSILVCQGLAKVIWPRSAA